jgi:hypothetical protein
MTDKVRVTTEVSVQDVCPECECTQIFPMADCRDPNCTCHEISNKTLDATDENIDFAGEDEDSDAH